VEKKVKALHYEEADDFDKVVDWAWVYSQPKWVRDEIISGKKVYVKKKKKKKDA